VRIGVREIVPIVLLLVALGIAFNFLDPSAGSSGSNTPASTVGKVPDKPTSTATPTRTPRPTPTPTRAPPQEFARPADWIVKFVSLSSTGSERIDAQVVLQSLDFNYSGAPFNDMRDDAWKLVADGVVELPSAGRYTFSFEHDGEARLFVDGREAAYEPDGAAPQTLRAVFEHAAGSLSLRIEVRDVTGPLKLKVP
jgi:hypothetical protein